MKKFRLIDNRWRLVYKDLEFNFLFFQILRCSTIKIPLLFLKKQIKWFNFKVKLTRIRTVCIFTGRTKSVYRFLRVSRMVLKGMEFVGYLPGLQRLSW